MQAIVKGENKILINGADHSERILIENIVNSSSNKEIKFESVLDINGDVTGCMITLNDLDNSNTATEITDESTNDSSDESNEE